MEFNRIKQIIDETNAKAIASQNRKRNQLAADSIVEETEKLELIQHLRIVEQRLKRLTGNIDEGWG